MIACNERSVLRASLLEELSIFALFYVPLVPCMFTSNLREPAVRLPTHEWVVFFHSRDDMDVCAAQSSYEAQLAEQSRRKQDERLKERRAEAVLEGENARCGAVWRESSCTEQQSSPG